MTLEASSENFGLRLRCSRQSLKFCEKVVYAFSLALVYKEFLLSEATNDTIRLNVNEFSFASLTSSTQTTETIENLVHNSSWWHLKFSLLISKNEVVNDYCLRQTLEHQRIDSKITQTWHFPIVADEITSSFRRYGPLIVDWPHKAESKSYFPPKGYAFLLFQVSHLIAAFNQHQHQVQSVVANMLLDTEVGKVLLLHWKRRRWLSFEWPCKRN